MASSSGRLVGSGWRRLVPRNDFKKLAGLGALLTLLLVKQVTKLVRRDSFVTKAHTSEEDVRGAVASYLEGRTSLEALDTWLTERTWENPDAVPLAHRVELMIVEATRGDRPDLAEDLRLLAQPLSGGVQQHVAS